MSNKKKAVKKKKVQNRRMRRTVMGTLSVVFMLSAIIVALIPTPKSEAANEDYMPDSLISDVTGNSSDYIPDYLDYPVYSSGDGAIMMAYGYKYKDNISKAGVIVNCNGGRISNGVLSISDEVPAYLHFNDKYIAVNKENQPLYYVSSGADSVIRDSNGNLLGLNSDADLTLCTADVESEWLGKDNVILYTDRTPKDPVINGRHFVSENSAEVNEYVKSEQLKIEVAYIGSKSCIAGNDKIAETWENATKNVDYEDESITNYGLDGDEKHHRGVFEGIGNLSRIMLPTTFAAVGDNAFRGTTLSSFDVGAHLTYIGNHAFRDSMLSTVNFFTVNMGSGPVSNLNQIGDFAFAGSKLSSIAIPDSVTGIGNFCFMDCNNLSAADLGNGSVRMLIGHGLFYNCVQLKQAVFPENVSNIDEVEYTFFKNKNLGVLALPDNPGRGTAPHIFKANNVMGCNNLKTVKVPSAELKFDCNHPEKVGLKPYGEYGDLYNNIHPTLDMFSVENLGYDAPRNEKYEVSEEFCVLANQNSYAYAYVMEHGLAFGYLDTMYEDRYEKTIDGYTFAINQLGELEYCHKIGDDGENVVIPSKIYKFDVKTILASTFKGNTDMKYVYIPKEVTNIEDNSFVGCTNLRTVYFEDATNQNLKIGDNAFKTGASCAGYREDGSAGVDDCLRFIGDITDSSPAYAYAMDPANMYNSGSATPQYITYCSYYPENLQVRLEKDSNGVLAPTLVDVPTEEELASLTSSSVSLNSVLNDGYSLSIYSGKYLSDQTNQHENQIALDAYAHYLADPSMNSLTEDERAVINSVYKIDVPPGVRVISDSVFKDNTGVKSVTLENVYEIPDEAFKGCTAMTDFTMRSTDNPDQEKIGARAFDDCENLENVSLSSTLKDMDLIPFTGCTSLNDVDFGNSNLFTCEDGIIYRDNGDGTRTIVECLENRGRPKVGVGSSVLGTSDFKDVSAIRPYAFYDCSYLTIAEMEESTVSDIPKSCFENATSLYMAELPVTTRSIGDDAFRNTQLSKLKIPVDAANISDSAFLGEDGLMNDTMSVTCPDGPTGLVWDYFNNQNIKTERLNPDKFTVIFVYGINGEFFDVRNDIERGQSVTPPNVTEKQFVGWDVDTSNVQSDIVSKAIYDIRNNVMEGRLKVEFMDDDGYVYSTQHVLPGECVKEPATKPNKKGYIFLDWDPSNYLEIPVTQEWKIFAKFEKDPEAVDLDDPAQVFTVTFVDIDGTTVLDSQKVNYGELPVPTSVIPKREGYEFSTWSPSNYAEVPVKTDITVTALYQKSAVDGTGNTTGNAGADIADGEADSSNPGGNNNNAGASNGNGNNGNNDSTNPDGTKPAASAQPSASAKPQGSKTNGGTVSGNSYYRKPTAGKETKVDVSKTGISNKNLVSASVAGSNDNFIVKITDSEEAKILVEQALLTEYGSLDNLKYFAMDISLYDSTGTTKIADTTGITVTVTMPLPDVMAGYAGNNKAMAVKNGLMERLGARLITIDNVPCISFEAKHFSPYAIYVETNNLTASGSSDVTPKTGDPIHPKWFLALGLALLSIIMFLGKGSNNKIVKVIK